jgi:hypothetical protein
MTHRVFISISSRYPFSCCVRSAELLEVIASRALVHHCSTRCTTSSRDSSLPHISLTSAHSALLSSRCCSHSFSLSPSSSSLFPSVTFTSVNSLSSSDNLSDLLLTFSCKSNLIYLLISTKTNADFNINKHISAGLFNNCLKKHCI